MQPDPRTPSEKRLDAYLAKHWRDKAKCREAIRKWEMMTFFFRRPENEQH